MQELATACFGGSKRPIGGRFDIMIFPDGLLIWRGCWVKITARSRAAILEQLEEEYAVDSTGF
jgi:hypothetical protein